MPTNPFAGMTPDQIAALPPAALQAMMAAAGAQTPGQQAAGAGADIDAPPDLDNATEGNSPRFTEGTFECDFVDCYTGKSNDPTKKIVPLFGANFKVVQVVEQGPIRPKIDKVDEDPPPGPVAVGEARGWRANTEPQNGKPNRNNFRIRELMQALLRFEPSSKDAESAVDDKGEKVKWNDVLTEAKDASNPLGGRPVRVTITRIITQKGKGFAMYVPTFTLSSRAVKRTSNVVDSL